MMKQKIWMIARPIVRPVAGAMIIVLFYLLRVFPIKKNKVLACVSIGRRYDDNQKFIMEDLQRMSETSLPWQELDGKTVLVTGATGMLASYVTWLLLYLREHQGRSRGHHEEQPAGNAPCIRVGQGQTVDKGCFRLDTRGIW